MNNLEHKKEQVRYWSAAGALVLTTLPLIKELKKKEPDLSGASSTLALNIGFASYYVLSSMFWPEPLSITNHLFLIPISLWTLSYLHQIGKMWLKDWERK